MHFHIGKYLLIWRGGKESKLAKYGTCVARMLGKVTNLNVHTLTGIQRGDGHEAHKILQIIAQRGDVVRPAKEETDFFPFIHWSRHIRRRGVDAVDILESGRAGEAFEGVSVGTEGDGEGRVRGR